MQDRLDYIVQQILAVAKDKIALIILYGSYARGDWVKDMYTADHTTYNYTSDFDFLVEKR
nr:nucleotidyltransferase domain-containing protein [Rickettsia conorii]